MRRLAWVALAAGVSCSKISEVPPGPTDSFYKPTGIGVYAGKLLVASSNADLRYDATTGGSIISVDPGSGADPAWPLLVSGMNIESFGSELAIADPADPRGPAYACPATGPLAAGPLALLTVRGSDLLYRFGLGAGGEVSCNDCAMSLNPHDFADAYALGVACFTPDPSLPADSQPAAMARAYVGYLRGTASQAWVTEVDLTTSPPTLRNRSLGAGQTRSFAYDPLRRRLYVAVASEGIQWIDLADGCAFDAAEIDGGCHGGGVALPPGLEARAIALSRVDAPGATRLYVLARVFDAQAASVVGVRSGDVDGFLLVMEPVDDLSGQTQLDLVKPPISVGYGPIALTLLPGRTGRRDIVAALTDDDPVLLLFDDDNDAEVVISRDTVVSGHPWVGLAPYGLAADPVPTGAGAAHVYVGSFGESFVTQIDVPLADIEQTTLPTAAAPLRHIFGGKP